MDYRTVAIRFPELELSDAGRAAQEVRESLLEVLEDDQVSIRKDDPTNQDFGATLIAVLAAPAIVKIAQGLAEWSRRRGQSLELEIDGEKTRFRTTGPIDGTAAEIVKALSGSRRK